MPILATLMLILLVSSARATCDTTASRNALITFYTSTSGPSWTSKTNWNTASDLSTWFGVICSNTDVIELNLDGNGLSGAVPSVLSSLTSLTRIHLNTNSLSGSLPSSWSSLTVLSDLQIENNALTGTLPALWSALTSLSQLLLDGNTLSGSLPSSWLSMTSLSVLRLAGNDLTGTLPSSWSSITSITVLDLSSNKLTGALPASWSALSNLNVLFLQSNSLSGSLPSSWSSLTSLDQLYGYSNSLSGTLPFSWSGITSMRRLLLFSNALTGTLPAEWSAMTRMSDLQLYKNGLSGSLPSSWSSMTIITRLYLQENKLNGTLPDSWSAMTALTDLKLSNNSLSGTLPDSWPSSLASLTQLLLSSNKLNGTIPWGWIGWPVAGSFDGLSTLDLSYNKLSGGIVKFWQYARPRSSPMTVTVCGNTQLCLIAYNATVSATSDVMLQGCSSGVAGLRVCNQTLSETNSYNSPTYSRMLSATRSTSGDGRTATSSLSDRGLSASVTSSHERTVSALSSSISISRTPDLTRTIRSESPSRRSITFDLSMSGHSSTRSSTASTLGSASLSSTPTGTISSTSSRPTASISGSVTKNMTLTHRYSRSGTLSVIGPRTDTDLFSSSYMMSESKTILASISQLISATESLTRGSSTYGATISFSPSTSPSTSNPIRTSSESSTTTRNETITRDSDSTTSTISSSLMPSSSLQPTRRTASISALTISPHASGSASPSLSPSLSHGTPTPTRSTSPSRRASASRSRTIAFTLSRVGTRTISFSRRVSRSRSQPFSETFAPSRSTSETTSDSCSSRDSIVYLLGSQVERTTTFIENATTEDIQDKDGTYDLQRLFRGGGGEGGEDVIVLDAKSVLYDVIKSTRVFVLLDFKPRLTVRSDVSVDSSIFSVEVLNLTQPPRFSHLRILLRLDARPNLNRLNVRDDTVVSVALNFSVGTFPTCQILDPSSVAETVTLTVTAPIQRQPSLISSTGVVSSVASSALSNPTPAVQQAIFMSFIDVATCAFSDVEPLESSSSPSGFGFGDELGHYYRGTSAAFLVCLCAIAGLGAAGIAVFAALTGVSRREAAARLHYPSVLIVPFALLVEGAGLSIVSLLRLSLDVSDMLLAAFTALVCCSFVLLGYVICSSRWWFRCVSEVREHPEGTVPFVFELLFKFTEPSTGWRDDAGVPLLYKKRYLLVFNETRSVWYCPLELGLALINGLIQGVRINDKSVCMTTAGALLFIHAIMFVVGAVFRPFGAMIGNVFLVLAKLVTVCCAAVTIASLLQEDEREQSALIGVVSMLATVGSVLVDAQTGIMIVAGIAKALLHWRSLPIDSPQLSLICDNGGNEEMGNMPLSVLIAMEGKDDDLQCVMAGELVLSPPPFSPTPKMSPEEIALAMRGILQHLLHAAYPQTPINSRLLHLVEAACAQSRCNLQRQLELI